MAFLSSQLVTRTKKIFVGGLSVNTTIEDVKQYFDQFGKVRDILRVLKLLRHTMVEMFDRTLAILIRMKIRITDDSFNVLLVFVQQQINSLGTRSTTSHQADSPQILWEKLHLEWRDRLEVKGLLRGGGGGRERRERKRL